MNPTRPAVRSNGHRAHAACILLASVALVAGSPLAAQDRQPAEILAPDRPGIGDGAHALAPGVIQVEGGIELSQDGTVEILRLGNLLVRYGLGPVEVRGLLNSYTAQEGGTEREGFEDVGLGVRVPILVDRGVGFLVSGQGSVTFPTGSRAVSAGQAVGSLGAQLEWSPPEVNFAVGGSAAASRPLDEGEPTWTFTVTPGGSIPFLGGAGGYGGWAGRFSKGEDEHWVEAGLVFLVARDLQLDVNGGWSPDRDDVFIGLGAARRIR